MKIHTVHKKNYGVYGARKVHAQLKRDGHRVARCTVERVDASRGITGRLAAQGATDDGPWTIQ